MADKPQTPNPDQQHPQWASDRPIVNQLLAGEPTDYNLAELARLLIRYQGFPGGRDIQADLEKVLTQWGLTQDALYEKTRAIHARDRLYTVRSSKTEDWN